MKKILILFLAIAFSSTTSYAANYELDDGSYVDEYGDIAYGKYDNTDMDAPWNDSFKKDDPFAPWNDLLMEDDPFAPWNSPFSDQRDTNKYLRDQGVKDSEYYWR